MSHLSTQACVLAILNVVSYLVVSLDVYKNNSHRMLIHLGVSKQCGKNGNLIHESQVSISAPDFSIIQLIDKVPTHHIRIKYLPMLTFIFEMRQFYACVVNYKSAANFGSCENV